MSTKYHGQTGKFLAVIAQNMPDLSSKDMQYWIDNSVKIRPVLACALTIDSKNSCILGCSQRLNISEFLGQNWSIDELDERSVALTEIDFSKILFETCLKEGQAAIKGEEKLERLKEMEDKLRLGDNVFLALWLDYKARGKDSILEWLRKNRDITYLDFFGLVLRNPGGRRYVLYLFWDEGKWFWSCIWLDVVWFAHFLSAAVASSELET